MTEPVSITAAITAAIQATLAILLFADVDPELVAALQVAVVAWVAVVAAVVRRKVTPLADPKAADGTPLVPADTI